MSKKIAYTEEELKNLDINVLITRGVLYAYGLITFEELYKIVKKYNRNLRRTNLVSIINKDETISKYFKMKQINTDCGKFDCVVYKKLKKNFLDEAATSLLVIKRKKLKKDEILIYSKYGMNINDKNISSLISILQEYFEKETLERIMEVVFRNLNYEDNTKELEVLLFDELVNSKKKKISGEVFANIKEKMYDVLNNSIAWKAGGNSVSDMADFMISLQEDNILDNLERMLDINLLEDCMQDIDDDDFPF